MFYINTRKLLTVVSSLFAIECLTSSAADLSARYYEKGVTEEDVLRADIIRELICRPRSAVRAVGTISYGGDPILAAYDVAYAYTGKFGLSYMYELFIDIISSWDDFVDDNPDYRNTMKGVFEYIAKTVESEAIAEGEHIPLDFIKESFIFDNIKTALASGILMRNRQDFYRDILRPYALKVGNLQFDTYFNKLILRIYKEGLVKSVS